MTDFIHDFITYGLPVIVVLCGCTAWFVYGVIAFNNRQIDKEADEIVGERGRFLEMMKHGKTAQKLATIRAFEDEALRGEK